MEKILIKPLQSSSKNNCINLSYGGYNIFLDFGASDNVIKSFFSINDIDLDKTIIFLTHGHIDHFTSFNNPSFQEIKTVLSLDCYKELKTKEMNLKNVSIAKNNNRWQKTNIPIIKYKSFTTFHNALGSICFLIKVGNKKILYLTDTEFNDCFIKNRNFKNLDCYLIESNYGSEYIKSGKKRDKHFECVNFHLNSKDAEKIILNNIGKKTKLILLTHVSSTSKDFLYLEILKSSISKNRKIEIDYINPFKNKHLTYKI